MAPAAIAGFLFAWCFSYVVVTIYSLTVWRRTGENEFRIFAALTAALTVSNTGYAWSYVASDEGPLPLALGLARGGQIAATALVLAFALAFTQATSARRIARGLYAVAALFELLNLFHACAGYRSAHFEAGDLFGLTVREVVVTPSVEGLALGLASVASVLAAGAILLRSYLAGRREVIHALVGTLLLSLAMVYFCLRVSGLAPEVSLAPSGFAAYTLGVIFTLLGRHSLDIDARTAELQRGAEELARSYEALRAAQSALVRKEQLAAVGELSAVIAHEVRNPLAIINNAVATLRRDGLVADDRETLLSILDEESSRLNRLVGDLLRYARPISVDRQFISVREIVERALSLVKTRPDVTIEWVERVPVERIWGDPNLIRQIVENLITNALQAMSSGGSLTVTLSPASRDGVEGVELQIQDTGEGMDTSVRTRALDPFFTTRPSGTGLGLAIVTRFVDAHDGKLEIRSAAGAGTVLHVFLPRASEGAVTRRSRAPEALPAASITPLPPMPAALSKIANEG